MKTQGSKVAAMCSTAQLHLKSESALQAMADTQHLLAVLVDACPANLKSRAVEDIGRVLGSSDDYIRKVALVRWHEDITAHAYVEK